MASNQNTVNSFGKFDPDMYKGNVFEAFSEYIDTTDQSKEMYTSRSFI